MQLHRMNIEWTSLSNKTQTSLESCKNKVGREKVLLLLHLFLFPFICVQNFEMVCFFLLKDVHSIFILCIALKRFKLNNHLKWIKNQLSAHYFGTLDIKIGSLKRISLLDVKRVIFQKSNIFTIFQGMTPPIIS